MQPKQQRKPPEGMEGEGAVPLLNHRALMRAIPQVQSATGVHHAAHVGPSGL